MRNLSERIGDLSPARRELLACLLKEKRLSSLRLPITPRRWDSAALPLSYAQRRLWFLNQLEPESSIYHVSTVIPVPASLSAEVIEKSINEIIRRHESLRTVFEVVSGQPVQVVVPEYLIELPVVDLIQQSEADRETELIRLVLREAALPFQLSVLPLMRTKLVLAGEGDQLLLLTMHHIITDGLSVKIFTDELMALSQAFSEGKPSPLSPLPIQYGDFAIWQQEWLQGEVLQTQLDYWKQQLADLTVLELPTDFTRPAVSTHHGGDERVELSDDLSGRIRELSRREGVTLFVTLLAAFCVLLSRYAQQDDIAVGTPVAGRDRVELEGLIGFFINTLVLRVDVSGNPTFRDLLGRVREASLGAFTHQDLPFEKLVEELHPSRDLSRNPLFQVSFQLLPEFGGIEEAEPPTRSAEIDQGTAMFDLGLDIWETDNGLSGMIEYSADLFERHTLRRMATHYRNLLASVAANPERRISELSVLSADEERQILVDWNQTAASYPKGVTLHQLFEEQVARTPDKVAVVFEQRRLTYGELNCRANQLAHYLKRFGIGPDVVVGICLERSPETLISLLAVLKAGACYVALEASYPQERLTFMLLDAKAKVVVTHSHLADRIPANLRCVNIDLDEQAFAREATENPPPEARAENLAVVIYTSGSTGRPKGVMLTHRGLCNRFFWGTAADGITDKDSILQVLSFSFDFSVWDVFTALFSGARLVMAQPGWLYDSKYLVDQICEEKVTVVGLVPSILEVLLNEPGIEDCKSLRKVFTGGETLSVSLQQRFFERLGAQLYNTYGPTETSIDVACWICKREDNQRSVPIGRPNANTQLYLLDQYLQPVPVGVRGELYIGGENLARGYLNHPQLTAEKFIPNPFSAQPGARLYRTGDLVRYRPDRELEFLGRIDKQVKLRGFRIELGEIEAMLAGHQRVAEVAVTTEERTNASTRLIAYVVPSAGQTVTANELRKYAKKNLPGYMVPSDFVFLGAMPRTANGKLDPRALPVVGRNRPALEEAFTLPRTPTEVVLAKIWTEVLGLEQLGVNDNFFELGGHSLLATQVISRVRATFQIEVPLRSIFETPTVAELAGIIDQIPQRQQRSDQIAHLPREQFRATLSPDGVPELSTGWAERVLLNNTRNSVHGISQVKQAGRGNAASSES